MAPTGISGGPPELPRLRRLWRLQEFLGGPLNYGAYGVYGTYGACRLGQAPNRNRNPNPNQIPSQNKPRNNLTTFSEGGCAPPAPPCFAMGVGRTLYKHQFNSMFK